MSGAGARDAVFPTRMALTNYKLRTLGAKKGYELLKKKSDALTVRLRMLLKEIKAVSCEANSTLSCFLWAAVKDGDWKWHAAMSQRGRKARRQASRSHALAPTRSQRTPLQTKLEASKLMQGATFGISEAAWSAGDFRRSVLDAPHPTTALVRVKVRTDNVAGVKLPVFDLVATPSTNLDFDVLGISGGGKQIGKAREKFTALLQALVKLGSLQTSFLTLDEAIKVTNRRVNALDNVVIPRLDNTISYITSELDEIEKVCGLWPTLAYCGVPPPPPPPHAPSSPCRRSSSA